MRGKRLGLPREYFVAGMEPGVEARVREAVAALEAAGAIVEEVSLPHTDYGLATYYIVAPAEASANLARYDGIRFGPRLGDGDVLANYLATRGRGFGAEVKRRIMLGTYALSAGYYDAYYLKAQKVRTLIKGDFDALWAQGFDALVAPTSPTVAFRLGDRLADPVSMYLSDACTLPVNMAGLPGVSIPCGLSDGLPVGLQLIGAPGRRRRCSGSRAATRRSPPTPTGGRSSRPSSRARRTPRSRPRPSGWPASGRRLTGARRTGSPRHSRPADGRFGPDGTRWSDRLAEHASDQEVTHAYAHRDRRRRSSGRPPASASVERSAGGGRGDSTRTKRPDRLPGDELVPTPTAIDTRGITIDAPPEAVWPWLVQMGYGRAGWYSYDRLDMRGKSVDTIVPKHQALAVGDLMPMSPEAGFEVKVLEPGRALVLYADTALIERPDRRARLVDQTDVPAGSGRVRRLPAADPAGFRRQLGLRRSSRSTAGGPG